MHVVVTGGSGFVGATMIAKLLQAGHRVTSLTRGGAAMPDGVDSLQHDLGSGPLTFPAEVDGVIHLAQSRAYRAFPEDAAEMFRVNVGGTQELLTAAATANVSRFCLISTGSVYEPFEGSLIEDVAVAPSSYLGASKLAGECLALPFNRLFPVSTLRLFGPYGPGQTARLLPDLIRRIQVEEAINLPARGGGMQFCPTYVDDICDLIIVALQEAWTGVYNVGARDAVTIEDVATIIGDLLKITPVIVRNSKQNSPAPVVVPDLTRLSQRYDLSKFRSLAEGLRSVIASAS